MELGKKLAAVEHLLSGSPKLVGAEGKTLHIDLRSSSPWAPSGSNPYFELATSYGSFDNRGVTVTVDTAGKEFTMEGRKAPLSQLQSELEQRHLVHMIEDLLVLAREKAAGLLVEALSAMLTSAPHPKPLPAEQRTRFAVLAGGLGDAAMHLAEKIEISAERWFEALGGLTRSEIDARLDKVQAFFDRGDHLAAREQLEELVDVVPDHARVQHMYGSLLLTEFGDTQLERAGKHLERAVKLDPKNAATRQCLGDVHFVHGDMKLAREHYEHALDLSSGGSYLALFGLGQVTELEGDYSRARSFFVRAARQAPTADVRRLIDLSDARVARRIAAKAN